MTYTFSTEIFSDLHKDAYGFRPREHRFYDEATTDAERQRIWDCLCQVVEDNIAAERAHKDRALADFSQRIINNLSMGAETVADAIRWELIVEQLSEHDLAYGEDYVAYHFGLAYDNPYTSQIRVAIAQLTKKAA